MINNSLMYESERQVYFSTGMNKALCYVKTGTADIWKGTNSKQQEKHTKLYSDLFSSSGEENSLADLARNRTRHLLITSPSPRSAELS